MDNTENFNRKVEFVIERYNLNITLKDIKKMFMTKYKNRHYHTLGNHIIPMVLKISEDFETKAFAEDLEESQKIYEKLLLTAIFHDIVYDPKSETNEIDSINYMKKCITEKTDTDIIDDVEQMILSTIDHKAQNYEQELFINYDLEILNSSLKDLLKWEKLIQKEFEFVNWSLYKEKRIEKLNSLIDKHSFINKQGILDLIDILNEQKPKIGIYAGSFNPFHNGHMDILKKAENIFDKVIIAKGMNSKKHIDTYEYTKEYKKLCKLLPGHEIVKYDGLLTDLIKKNYDSDITLIRGLRNGYDLDTENILTTFIKDFFPEIKIIYIRSEKEFEHISSSAIKELAKYNKDILKNYLPTKYIKK